MGNLLPKFVPEFQQILCNMEGPYIGISEPTHADGRSPLQAINLTSFVSFRSTQRDRRKIPKYVL
jgi:hypothetical protein